MKGLFMRYFIPLSVLLFVLTIAASVPAAETTLAVLDFENNSFFHRDVYESLSKGLADMMITELSTISSLKVVERQKLRSILEEMQLSQSGMVSEQNSVQVGKMLGAAHLVFGGFMVTMDEKIRVDMRIVEVETGLTVKAGEMTGKTKEVLTLVKKLSEKILKDLQIATTRDELKGLESGKQMDMKAVVWYSKGIEFEDQKQWDKAMAAYKEAMKIEPKFTQASDRLKMLASK